MAEPRLKTKLWVAATLRAYDIRGVPAMVVRKGEADSGAVLIKLNQFASGCSVLSQARRGEGELVWLRATGPVPVDEASCDAYIAKTVSRDPDVWVIEIEDREGRQLFDGRIV